MTRGDASFDLTVARSIHVVGLGGAGMSAIATVLVGMGHRVSGSDLRTSSGLERLRALGVDAHVGHLADHVGEVDAVAISTAVPEHNVEVQAARRRGIPVLSRAEVLAAICETRKTVAVAGTHGKTTTSSMLALVLREAALAPSFLIGGEVNEIGAGAHWDEGELFVVEADESDGTFLALDAYLPVVTNVEPDHLEHWGGAAALEEAFRTFAAAGALGPVVSADDPGAAPLAATPGAVTFGTAPGATLEMTALTCDRQGARFGVRWRGEDLGELQLPLPGAHNAHNAAAATAAALVLGAPFAAAQRALGRFAGVARRFEHRGNAAGITFVDDYAHLPGEVRAALAAARTGGWDRVVCVFQPHRYSRTAALWQEFADAFTEADVVVLTDVYASGEPPRPGVSGRLLVEAVLGAHPWSSVAYLPRLDDVADYLGARLRRGDLCLTLGAGDLTAVPDVVLGRLAETT